MNSEEHFGLRRLLEAVPVTKLCSGSVVAYDDATVPASLARAARHISRAIEMFGENMWRDDSTHAFMSITKLLLDSPYEGLAAMYVP